MNSNNKEKVRRKLKHRYLRISIELTILLLLVFCFFIIILKLPELSISNTIFGLLFVLISLFGVWFGFYRSKILKIDYELNKLKDIYDNDILIKNTEDYVTSEFKRKESSSINIIKNKGNKKYFIFIIIGIIILFSSFFLPFLYLYLNIPFDNFSIYYVILAIAACLIILPLAVMRFNNRMKINFEDTNDIFKKEIINFNDYFYEYFNRNEDMIKQLSLVKKIPIISENQWNHYNVYKYLKHKELLWEFFELRIFLSGKNGDMTLFNGSVIMIDIDNPKNLNIFISDNSSYSEVLVPKSWKEIKISQNNKDNISIYYSVLPQYDNNEISVYLNQSKIDFFIDFKNNITSGSFLISGSKLCIFMNNCGLALLNNANQTLNTELNKINTFVKKIKTIY